MGILKNKTKSYDSETDAMQARAMAVQDEAEAIAYYLEDGPGRPDDDDDDDDEEDDVWGYTPASIPVPDKKDFGGAFVTAICVLACAGAFAAVAMCVHSMAAQPVSVTVQERSAQPTEIHDMTTMPADEYPASTMPLYPGPDTFVSDVPNNAAEAEDESRPVTLPMPEGEVKIELPEGMALTP